MRAAVLAVVLSASASGSCGSEEAQVGPDQLYGVYPGRCVEGRTVELDCYSGPPETVGVGECRMSGVAQCHRGEWVCSYEVLPSEELPCDFEDNDCDGQVDENTPPEVCDYLDNDCDGEEDEGVIDETGFCPVVPCSADEPECSGFPPMRCEGNDLLTWGPGVCVDGACQWEQQQSPCPCGCVIDECREHCTP